MQLILIHITFMESIDNKWFVVFFKNYFSLCVQNKTHREKILLIILFDKMRQFIIDENDKLSNKYIDYIKNLYFFEIHKINFKNISLFITESELYVINNPKCKISNCIMNAFKLMYISLAPCNFPASKL